MGSGKFIYKNQIAIPNTHTKNFFLSLQQFTLLKLGIPEGPSDRVIGLTSAWRGFEVGLTHVRWSLVAIAYKTLSYKGEPRNRIPIRKYNKNYIKC